MWETPSYRHLHITENINFNSFEFPFTHFCKLLSLVHNGLMNFTSMSIAMEPMDGGKKILLNVTVYKQDW